MTTGTQTIFQLMEVVGKIFTARGDQCDMAGIFFFSDEQIVR